jgi:hypothetical protein
VCDLDDRHSFFIQLSKQLHISSPWLECRFPVGSSASRSLGEAMMARAVFIGIVKMLNKQWVVCPPIRTPFVPPNIKKPWPLVRRKQACQRPSGVLKWSPFHH